MSTEEVVVLIEVSSEYVEPTIIGYCESRDKGEIRRCVEHKMMQYGYDVVGWDESNNTLEIVVGDLTAWVEIDVYVKVAGGSTAPR